MRRKIHLVGSFPPEITGREPREAWAWVRENVGDTELLAWPFDDDPRWIVRYMQGLDERGTVRAIRGGDFSDYDSVPIYRLAGEERPGPAMMRDDARADRARELVGDYRRSDTGGAPVQLSRPNPLDLGLMTMVGKPQLRHALRTLRGTFLMLGQLPTLNRAARQEIRHAARLAREHDVPVVWQLETPAVLYALNLLPPPLRPVAARLLARQVAGVLALIPRESAVLHLCYGGLGRAELIAPRSTRPAVIFLNALARRLRRQKRPLPPVHIPFAYGTRPPPTLAHPYAPLKDLDPKWRLIAGVADENDPGASHTALDLVEKHSGRQAEAVATACGLGRHSEPAARKALALLAELAGKSTAAAGPY
ncbi:hypothetical protein LHJ74_12725 [Streptomyces sp. N2-109]|uniref:Uncharacterized protein n=1 Tax=Streptomyces gossypii TaxID=2883101 RepID=A0ABT2JTF1_9ACTN|nr:hypothetical protein [Streptomyces gossypii]MCT2590764.1 hypothetical protein [Streptomyces gossypii]